MAIKFSRHARRRAQLYNLPEKVINDIISEAMLSDGEHILIKDITGFKYPVKVVVRVEGDLLTIITNYPLKKGRGQ
ncbi:MAG: hypothetical protein SWH68_12630 [Thermodesulfobacteriota bacterium]|nr:hypothetical protein [Thermodesulfobacteriota bacterium]